MKKANQWVNLCFFLVILFFLLAGLARILFWPKEINYYENRYAYTVEELSSENFLSGTFQDSVEKALSDQVPLAQRLKSQYHRLSVSFQLKTLEGFIKAHPDLYVNFLGNSVFGGNCLMSYPAPLEEKLAVLEPRIENINSMLDRHPELEFYVFYIEKDTDMNFSTGKNTGFSSYVQENLHLDASHFGLFQVTNFDFFSYDADVARPQNHVRLYAHKLYRYAGGGHLHCEGAYICSPGPHCCRARFSEAAPARGDSLACFGKRDVPDPAECVHCLYYQFHL